MREIKFRGWDIKNQQFVNTYDYACQFDGSTIYNHDHYEWTSYLNSTIQIQQYTGLKDKNGKEIYEGDIVKATSDQYTNENFVGKVIFDEGYFCTWVNKNDIRGIWGEDDIEVIGNIFENSEHLEK